MKETVEFRIFPDYFHLLPEPNQASFNGIVYVIEVSTTTPLFEKIGNLEKYVRQKFGKSFFGYWEIKRKYSEKEFANARLLRLKIKRTFEPAGEECGTLYDESVACETCGANRKQVGPLRLKRSSIPQKDISRTIAGEVVVSKRFAAAVDRNRLNGMVLAPVAFKQGSSVYQLTSSAELDLSPKTITGLDPFDKSTEIGEAMEFSVSGYPVKFEREVYVCPKGHLIGANLVSEPHVLNVPEIDKIDFFASRQKIGVKRGLLRPEPVYFCSPKFREVVRKEGMTGFGFEIARIE